MNDFPEVMQNAREDLLANVSGRFSPQDWQSILHLAKAKWSTEVLGEPLSSEAEINAWRKVILDFNRNAYWGFVPNYRPEKVKKKSNEGIRFILIATISFTFTKMAVAWLGQRYSSSDEPRDAYIFFAVLALVVANFGYFLWRTRGHKD